MRRVFARTLQGVELPSTSVTRAERELALEVLPADDATAATWSVAVMELGALVCTAARPRCERCPVAGLCTWRAAGDPAYDGPARKVQTWAGTDRQCRGRLLGVLRDSHGPVHRSALEAAWPQEPQRLRCLASLVEDALVVHAGPDTYALP